MIIVQDWDSLDKEMTLAYIQGKFMMKCTVAKSGHHVHEDCPDEVAKMIENFIKVFKLGFKEK